MQNNRIKAVFFDERVGRLPEGGLICPVEVRILHRTANGWRGHVYVPVSEQMDVWTRITRGQKVNVALSGERENAGMFTYDVPSIGDCANCHFGEDGISPIGPRDDNRIIWLSQDNAASIEPVADDQGPDREALARRYLDINCAHCHSQAGLAASSALYLGADRPLGRGIGLCKPVVAAGRGFGADAYSIKPGDAESSVIIQRMRSLAAGEKMPELGRATVDHYGIQVVSDWIDSLEGGC